MNNPLQGVYDKLPPTVCDRRGNCCTIWAEMSYVEYENIRDYIATHWPPERQKDLRQQVIRQFEFRRAAPKLHPEGGMYWLKPHCILYDETDQKCSVYNARPLTCRAFGFDGNCSLVRMKRDPNHRAMDLFSRSELVELFEGVRALNSRYRDPASGKEIAPGSMLPIEFWFALEYAGWDPMLDPDDEAFLGPPGTTTLTPE